MNSGGSSSSGRWTMNPPEGISDGNLPAFLAIIKAAYVIVVASKELGYGLCCSVQVQKYSDFSNYPACTKRSVLPMTCLEISHKAGWDF